jgi:hypothetical protein
VGSQNTLARGTRSLFKYHLNGSDSDEHVLATNARTVMYQITKFFMRSLYVIRQWPIGCEEVAKDLATKLSV